jgi:PAS domain S-box-containing protein
MNNPQDYPLKDNVLIVDDNPVNLNLLSEILSKQGYKVRAALSSTLALKSVQLNQPDLILLDILMPEMDGYEVCQKLKSSPTTQDIPVIFISALNEVLDKIKAFSLGGVDYITKPFQAEEVLARIENQLRVKRLSNQLLQQNSQLHQELLERQRAEQALRHSEERYRSLVMATSEAVWTTDAQGNMQTLPPDWLASTGQSAAEVQNDQWLEAIHPDDQERVKQVWQSARANQTLYEIEYRLRTVEGQNRDILMRGVPVRSCDGQVREWIGTYTDITDHKQAEAQIKASLKEKEVLLKEIHHRVKNNLQIVSSLLQMQFRRTQEKEAAIVLQDSQNRIASIALVHEKLYRSDDLANIDFAQYIPALTAHLFDSYKVNDEAVVLQIKVDNIRLEIETAIPCSLIINELVSNSLKYAFPANRKGEIQIEFHTNSDHTMTLIVRDNGIGISEDFDITTTTSLGLTVVQGLVEQLEGTLELDRTQGTEFKITFPAGGRR